MKLYFATDARFIKKGNKYYSFGGFSIELWKRYLEHFDEIIVIARVNEDSTISTDRLEIASCEYVSYIDLPYYVGFKGYIQKIHAIKSVLRKYLKYDGCYICRLPGQIGGAVVSVLRERKIPYSCEVVGNPWDVYSKGSIIHPMRAFLRIVSTYQLKKQVKHTNACLYVTQNTLQRMYPVKDNTFNIGVSDVIIRDNLYAKKAKVLEKKQRYYIASIGSLAQMYKGADILIEALSILKDHGFELHLTWLGDGVFKQEMIKLARKLGVSAEFKGNVSTEVVHEVLDNTDIFVLASRTEGLPRALVEAMAHGIPCIGTCVGGIPELLDDSAIVEKDNPVQLAKLIQKMIINQEYSNDQAKRNLNNSLLYEENRLKQMRNRYFAYVKALNKNK